MGTVTTRETLDPAPTEDVVRLSPRARTVRLVLAGLVLAMLATGTVFGQDDAFPFGPFRMYSTRAEPDAPVLSTRVVGYTAAEVEVTLSGGEVGLRRAEFEGQVPRLIAEPELLGLLADIYATNHPGAEPLVAVGIITREYELRDGQRTGRYDDDVRVVYDLATESVRDE